MSERWCDSQRNERGEVRAIELLLHFAPPPPTVYFNCKSNMASRRNDRKLVTSTSPNNDACDPG